MSLLSTLIRELFASSGRRRDAEQKGARLLADNLTPAQRQQYEQYRHFDVTGGDTGHRYRIRYGTSMNIDELDVTGDRIKKVCFFPVGNLVIGDVLLAQKIALELFETEALATANRFPIVHPHSMVRERRYSPDVRWRSIAPQTR